MCYKTFLKYISAKLRYNVLECIEESRQTEESSLETTKAWTISYTGYLDGKGLIFQML